MNVDTYKYTDDITKNIIESYTIRYDTFLVNKIEECNNDESLINFQYVYEIYMKIKVYSKYIDDVYNENLEFDKNHPEITPSVLYGGLFYIIYIKSSIYRDFLNNISEIRNKLEVIESQMSMMIENKEYYASFYYINLILFKDIQREVTFFKDVFHENLSNFDFLENII